MKKTICILAGAALAIALYWLGFVNGVYYNEVKTKVVSENVDLSDEELVSNYITERYGSDYYGIIWGDSDGYIKYEVYDSDGELTNLCTTNREWLQGKYETN